MVNSFRSQDLPGLSLAHPASASGLLVLIPLVGVANGGSRNRSHPAAKRTQRAFVFSRMDVVGEKDHETLRLGINPYRRTGVSRVAVGAYGKQFSPVLGERRIDIPPQSALYGLIGWRLRMSEFLDGLRREQPFPKKHASI